MSGRRATSEVVADSELHLPHGRAEVDLVVVVERLNAIELINDVAALVVDAVEAGDVLEPREIAAPLHIPIVVEQVQEVVDGDIELDRVADPADAKQPGRSRQLLREGEIEVVIPVVRAGVGCDRAARTLCINESALIA